MYHLPFSIRMAPTSAARASTHRMTAATRLPVALFLLAAVTTAGPLLVLPVEASTNSRSTFFFSAKLGHSFSITKIGRNADFIVPSMRQMRKAFFVEKGQPPEAAPGGADYSSSRRSSSTAARTAAMAETAAATAITCGAPVAGLGWVAFSSAGRMITMVLGGSSSGVGL